MYFKKKAAAAGGGAPSALYTAATAVYDFENNANDTKGTYNLTGSGSPTYDGTDKKQGGYSAVFVAASTQYFYYNDDIHFDPAAGNYSLSFWFRVTAPELGYFINKHSGADGDGYRMSVNYDTDLHLWMFHETGYSNAGNFTTFKPSANTWYHVAFSFNATATQITLWVSQSTFGDIINGTTYTNAKKPNNNTSPFSIGKDVSNYMNGKMDEVVFWKGTAITSTDAANLFAGTWR